MDSIDNYSTTIGSCRRIGINHRNYVPRGAKNQFDHWGNNISLDPKAGGSVQKKRTYEESRNQNLVLKNSKIGKGEKGSGIVHEDRFRKKKVLGSG